ncbi:MAG TPA: sugar ABC transporter substrate-binding protein [Chloroflexia bacterium]|nr:sugar ABC transporter substrate-binding protein [Chloroflexia bacterium]
MKMNFLRGTRLLAIMMVSLMLAAVLAACGDNTNTAAPAAGGTTGAGAATTAAGATAASGASGQATTAAALPTSASGQQGGELRIIAANHPWTTAIQKLIPDFEKQTGIKVKVENYFEDQLSQKLQIGLTSGSSGVDVFMFRPLQEGKLFANNGWLNDLSGMTQNGKDWNWNDFQEATRNTVTFDNKVYGVPIVTEREIVYYRKDLFEQAGLKAPTTMDELMAAAKKLTDPSKGQYGIVMRGQRSPAVTQFSSFLYSYGGTWIKDGKSAIGSPEALQAYKTYGDLLRQYGPQGTLNMSWPQAVAIFQQGKAAMWIDADSLYTNVLDKTKSTVADKVGYAQFPAGPAGSKPYNITSWALGMNAASSNKEAAWKFIQWATSKDMVMQLQQGGLPGARTSVWDDPAGLKGFPEEYAKVAQSSAKVGVGFDRPLVVNVGQARDIVGNPIVVSIQGGDVNGAVTDADKKFNDFLATDKNAKQ